MGRDVPPEVVHALLYSFADGEVTRRIPHVWDGVTPEAANAAREQRSVAALRRILGATSPRVRRRPCWRHRHQPGTRAPTEGGPLPTDPMARLWHGPTCSASTAATATSARS